MIEEKSSGNTKRYLNAQDLCNEYGITFSTLYRILTGKPSRKYDKQYLFSRIREPVSG